MDDSQTVRKKLVLLIGNLICRCIEEARKIPYVLDQAQVVQILLENPASFAELVLDEQRHHTEFSSNRLTAKLDAAAELGQFESLDAFDVTFSSGIESDAALEPVLAQINQLTRLFSVYLGNMIAIFEKEFQLFMEKFRQAVQAAGSALQTVEFMPDDMETLEKRAEKYLKSRQYLQAFSFDRLLNSAVITPELVILPTYSLRRKLIKNALVDPDLCPSLMTFILRASYISQGSWQDLFYILSDLVSGEAESDRKSMLMDRIEQDSVLCCNLFRESFADIKKWSFAERRAAIEKVLERSRHQAEDF
jgi:hypothetical protein